MKFTQRICILLVALLAAGSVLYANEMIDGWEVALTENNTCTLIKPLVGKYRKDSVVIPAKIGEYTVTALGESLFKGIDKITDVEIPESVTSIGASAFSGCTKLSTLELPDSITAIGNGAFKNCTSLKNINRPKGISKIKWFVLLKTTGIEVPFPDGRKFIISDTDYNYILAEDAKGTFYFYNLTNKSLLGSSSKPVYTEGTKLEKSTVALIMARATKTESLVDKNNYVIYNITREDDWYYYYWLIVKTPRGNYYELK